MKLFAVLDVKSEFFLRPFVDTSTANALRGFAITSSTDQSPFNQFPDDFALFELGSIDLQTGTITPHSSPINLGSARTVMKSDMPVARKVSTETLKVSQ